MNDAWLSSGQVVFDQARMGILKAYEQAFIDVVRATGGNNATRSLIVQGERDALGNRETVSGYSLAPGITLEWLAAADHDLKPLKASGLTHAQHLQQAAERVADFLRN